MFTLDANILIYAADKAAAVRNEIANHILDRAAFVEAALTEQSLFEFFHAATRNGKMSRQDAACLVQKLAEDFPVMHPPLTIVSDSLALQERYGLSIWDSRLLAVCTSHGCDVLLSEDLQDGRQYGDVTVVNPFNQANAFIVAGMLLP